MSLEIFDLSGRRALVTGASRGIGHALARGLAAAGAAVAINGRNPETLARAAEALEREGARVFTAPFDVSEPDEVDAGIARIEERFGPIDILVNNAGIQRRGALLDISDEDWQAIMRVQLDAVFMVSQRVARGMVARGHGRIINICSVLSGLARPGAVPYGAAKAAVANLTRGMAAEWAPRGLNVNAIAPGYFRTEMTAELAADEKFTAWLKTRTPQGRWGRPEELIGAAVFLASDAAGFVNGHILYVDGGLTATL